MSLKLIATTTVGSGGAASIDIDNIPGTYTDLMLVLSGRSTRASEADNVYIKINNTTADYSARALQGNGASASSFVDNTDPTVYIFPVSAANATSNTFSNGVIYFPNYSGSTNKSFSTDSVTENNATTAYQTIGAGIWANTAAITRITLSNDVGNFVQHTTATVYGITKGSDGIVTTS
jgi:hypothetical protein